MTRGTHVINTQNIGFIDIADLLLWPDIRREQFAFGRCDIEDAIGSVLKFATTPISSSEVPELRFNLRSRHITTASRK
jgi:hypothetical protein